MTGIEKVRKLIEVKERTQKEAREVFKNDPKIRAIYERLEKKNREKPPSE